MKKTIYILIILISFSGLSQQSTEPVNQNQILLYGLVRYPRIKAMEFAAEKYNLKVKAIAGCIITQNLVDSVNTVHKNLWGRMDNIYGIGAKERYDKSVDYEFSQILEASNFIQNNRKLQKLLKKIKKENEDSTITLESKINDHSYSWIISSLNSVKYSEKRWNPEFEVVVDLSQMNYSINRKK